MTAAARLLLVFAFLNACEAPVSIQEIPGEHMPYAGGESDVALAGPSGQVIELAADGVNTIQWAPVDRRAMEVEIRIRLLNHLNPDRVLSDPPLLRASLTFGHGKLTWQEPFIAPPFATSEVGGLFAYHRYAVPARGVVWRVDARELKLYLQSPGTLSGAASYPRTSVMVSFQPCQAMERPVFPQMEYAVTALGPPIVAAAFPQAANEWRLFDANGLPFVAGDVVCAGLEVETYTVPRAQLADFRPIPFHAVGWLCDVPAYAEYR
jgi:hypothetical protein